MRGGLKVQEKKKLRIRSSKDSGAMQDLCSSCITMQKEACITHERDPSELSYFMVPRESQPKRMPLMFTVTSTSFSSTRTGIFLLCCDTV